MTEGNIDCPNPKCGKKIETPLLTLKCPHCGTDLKKAIERFDAEVNHKAATLKALRKAMRRSERLKETEQFKSMTYVMRKEWIDKIADDAERKHLFAKNVMDEIMEAYWKYLRPEADKKGITVLRLLEQLFTR